MSASVPQIVASVNFLSQTSNLAASTLYTPAAAGNYRVSVYVTITAGAGSFVQATLGYTDESGAVTNNTQIEAATSSPAQACIPIYAEASAITIAVSIQSGSPTYNVRTVVESL